MPTKISRRPSLSGFTSPLTNLQQEPIIAQRDPTALDQAELGTIWINQASDSYFILTSVGVWTSATGGATTLTSLTVNPGNITVTAGNIIVTVGDVTLGGTLTAATLDINNATFNNNVTVNGTLTVETLTSPAGMATTTTTTYSVVAGSTLALTSTNAAMTLLSGTGVFGISTDNVNTTLNIGTGAGAKLVTLGSTTGASTTTIHSGPAGNIGIGSTGGTISVNTAGGILNLVSRAGSINLSNDAFDTTVQIANGAGAKTVTLGSTNTTSTTTVQAGTGGIILSAAGNLQATPDAQSAGSPTASVTSNHNLVSATFTGFTTASAASQVFTITNSLIATTSFMFVTASNLGTNDAQMTVYRVQPKAGSVDVTLKNNGAAALNGDVHINLWVYAP